VVLLAVTRHAVSCNPGSFAEPFDLNSINILPVGVEGEEMASSSIIGANGEVTIPKRIRTRLGLREGDRVEFVVRWNDTFIRPVRAASNPFEKYAGILGTFPGGKKEINTWVRSLRDDDPDER
jgi:AbrB family looped-hinge helix DNA binding protein